MNQESYFLKPIHLTDQQIIELMKVCFQLEFLYSPKSEKSELILFVRKNQETDYGFDFWFKTKAKNRELNFKGAIFGTDDLLISNGSPEDLKYNIRDDWENHFTVPIKAVYEFLQSIHFFKKQNKMPLVNRLLEQTTWTQIYRKQY